MRDKKCAAVCAIVVVVAVEISPECLIVEVLWEVNAVEFDSIEVSKVMVTLLIHVTSAIVE